MNGDEFKARLRLLGRTQLAFAQELGVGARTVQSWAKDGPPSEVSYLLDLLSESEMPLGPSDLFAHDLEIMKVSIFHRLDVLLGIARSAGRDEDFKKLVRGWLQEHL
jgi:transcriptional regulator with XRE-family HTH domain